MNWQHFWAGVTLGSVFSMLLVIGIGHLADWYYKRRQAAWFKAITRSPVDDGLYKQKGNGHVELHHAHDCAGDRSDQSG